MIPEIEPKVQSWTLDDMYGGGSTEIIVDTREPPEYYNFLCGMFPNHKFIWQKLDEGDFQSSRVLVERKQIGDLYGSIFGSKGKPGRLPAQVSRLSLHEDQVVLILVTGSIQEQMKLMERELGLIINPDIIYGTLASISCRERIHILWIENEWSALVNMIKFMTKVEEGKYMVPSKREPITLWARLLGVTPKQMEALMMKYPSVASISRASPKDLQFVPGIGKQKSQVIIERLNNQWG
jgi:ERCC4-type nuclease